MATAMASRDRSIAPRRDSSASKLCGGIRAMEPPPDDCDPEAPPASDTPPSPVDPRVGRASRGEAFEIGGRLAMSAPRMAARPCWPIGQEDVEYNAPDG